MYIRQEPTPYGLRTYDQKSASFRPKYYVYGSAVPSPLLYHVLPARNQTDLHNYYSDKIGNPESGLTYISDLSLILRRHKHLQIFLHYHYISSLNYRPPYLTDESNSQRLRTSHHIHLSGFHHIVPMSE